MPRTIAYRAGGFTNCGISYTKFSQEELAEMKDRTMTENEAIKELETSIDLAKMCTQNYERKREIQGYEMAINALEEVQKYRAIGTPEECRAAVEKQTAKKIVRRKATDEDVENGLRDFITIKGMIFRCPTCGCCIAVDGMESCWKCGQILDWSDEE